MRFIVLGVLCAALGTAIMLKPEKTDTKRIGIVVPLEHKAMDDILAGFKERIGDSAKIEVQNAGGDLHMQRAMIETFARQEIDLVATIGTDVTLTAMHRIKETPIVGIDVTDQVVQIPGSNVTGIRETPIAPSYVFIKKLLPEVKKIAMVYSSSDKNHQMLGEFSQLAHEDGVAVQPVLVQSMAELYVLAKAIQRDVDAIFIAKDHLVASGAPVLSKVAEELGVPFITSDDGSILAGGTVALANKERDIGEEAGEIALQVLSGKLPSQISIQPISRMTIFVSSRKCHDPDAIAEVANHFDFPMETIE